MNNNISAGSHNSELSQLTKTEFLASIIGAGFMHFYYIFVFLLYDVPFMAIINVASVLFYAFLAIYIQREHFLFITIGVSAEVIWHVTLSTLIMGWDFGFQIALIVLIPMCVFTSRISFLSSAIISFISIGFFVVLKNISPDSIARDCEYFGFATSHVYTINAVSCCGILFVLSRILLREQLSFYNMFNTENKMLKKYANYDVLTGLINRRYMYETIDLAEKQRTEKGQSFAVTICDIDNFKRINDTYGHDCGDEVLKCVAKVLEKSVSESGATARWGGEEFLVLTFFDTSDETYKFIEKVRKSIEQAAYEYDNKNIDFTMTFGICTEKLDIPQMLRAADEYLYSGKSSGKNVVIGDGTDRTHEASKSAEQDRLREEIVS